MSNFDFKPRNVYQANRKKNIVYLSVQEPTKNMVEQAVIGIAQSMDKAMDYHFMSSTTRVELKFSSVDKAKEFKNYIDTGSTYSSFERLKLFLKEWRSK